MKNVFALLCFSATVATCAGQMTPGKLSFALPLHAGSLSLDQGDFKIRELSAKPNNQEFGIRAKVGDLDFLGFLFLWPEKPNLSAESCRDEMLNSEGTASLVPANGRLKMKSSSGADIALALMLATDGSQSAVRAFVASGELCGDLDFTLHKQITKQIVPMQQVKDILTTLRFDPQAKPTFREAFAYATVEWDKQQIKGAASAYQAALNLVDTSDDPLKWRRVTTDQLSMALGMSGDLARSRAVNQNAIEKDPTYPLYYFNLACADAEAGNATAARTHLQQSFDRRSNTLAGEKFPDPAADDSIQKLKNDKPFWAFVESLSKQLH